MFVAVWDEKSIPSGTVTEFSFRAAFACICSLSQIEQLGISTKGDYVLLFSPLKSACGALI